MSGYAVKELFLTLQGEGMQAGRRAVFVRFAGCNLWSGREQDRAAAVCDFCDTDFVGMDGESGGRYADAEMLARRVTAAWNGDGAERPAHRYVVLTGGEPMLQVDPPLVSALKRHGFEVAIETNGTLPVADGIDWICVSPKGRSAVVQRSGDELKLVWPQDGIDPIPMESWAFRARLIQPKDGPYAAEAQAACIAFVMRHPSWRLSIQTHKLLGLR